MKRRAPAYWPTRIMLAIGICATVIVVAVALAVALAGPPFTPMFGKEPTVLGLPNRIAGAALGVAVAVGGLVWMLRIFRGPRDQPPGWRYRRR